MCHPSAPVVPQCGLTPRSRRGPTANRQARLQVRYIILPPGLALYRRSRLNSNVRPRLEPVLHRLITARPSGLASQAPPRRAAQRRPLNSLLFVVASSALGRTASPHTPPSVRHGRKRFAGSTFFLVAIVNALRAHGARKAVLRARRALAPCALPLAGEPNPSVKRTLSGMPPGPGRRYAVHCRQPGPGVMPLRSAYLKR